MARPGAGMTYIARLRPDTRNLDSRTFPGGQRENMISSFFSFSFCRILTGGVGAACLYMYIL